MRNIRSAVKTRISLLMFLTPELCSNKIRRHLYQIYPIIRANKCKTSTVSSVFVSLFIMQIVLLMTT